MKFVPFNGSPPMPTAVVCPSPALLVWNTASYVSVPERDTTPTLPPLKIEPGMIPILHSPGVSTPGQFGPISRELEPVSARLTLTMSSTGIPSVIATISGTSASIASRIESAANGGGT